MPIINFFKAVGVVAVPLLIFSVVSVALIAERLLFWFRVNRRQRRVVRDTLRMYRQDPVKSINYLQQNADLPIAKIFLEALELDHPNPEEFRIALESAAQAELPSLKRFNSIFDTIIGISPLLGLLGTILGLMTAFSSLRVGDVGGSSTAEVTGGISEALASTALGLVVAIITLFFTNMFRAFYQRQLALIQEYGGQLELLYRRQYEQGRDVYAASR
ncbi:MAG: MotA/TolQ/ExbB proton channel family protein [Symploca sp. SIO2G7]|nr:MotA/TolQ/ExbB proton channel family protein [Symploca sp. SIO2G7]